ncbi:hypothetical protein HCH_04859 [Hahella chejuensis KCTC 2396]|uniref:Uncharacterized protein n=1 Tax=Hahella chejuensis (strain KCTC 2396) TaxID=349521 RepID=Q2SCS3_HAHCH|nr:hypothetical protein HCH_04859 [Hahella chejuensis KCTC 2396]
MCAHGSLPVVSLGEKINNATYQNNRIIEKKMFSNGEWLWN